MSLALRDDQEVLGAAKLVQDVADDSEREQSEQDDSRCEDEAAQPAEPWIGTCRVPRGDDDERQHDRGRRHEEVVLDERVARVVVVAVPACAGVEAEPQDGDHRHVGDHGLHRGPAQCTHLPSVSPRRAGRRSRTAGPGSPGRAAGSSVGVRDDRSWSSPARSLKGSMRRPCSRRTRAWRVPLACGARYGCCEGSGTSGINRGRPRGDLPARADGSSATESPAFRCPRTTGRWRVPDARPWACGAVAVSSSLLPGLRRRRGVVYEGSSRDGDRATGATDELRPRQSWPTPPRRQPSRWWRRSDRCARPPRRRTGAAPRRAGAGCRTRRAPAWRARWAPR